MLWIYIIFSFIVVELVVGTILIIRAVGENKRLKKDISETQSKIIVSLVNTNNDLKEIEKMLEWRKRLQPMQ